MFKTKKFWLIVIIVFALLNVLLAVFYEPLARFGKKALSRQPVYYAVHLNNGHVYFGRIKSIKPETIILTDVFYLEASESEQQTYKIYNLMKRGSTNPLLTDNVLFINRSAVLFWEKLLSDSEIMKLIINREE